MTDPRVTRTRDRALAAGRHLLLTAGLDAVTHLQVARESGVGRRTLYRHWAEPADLLHDVLSASEVPHAPVTGDLRTDLLAHLEALRRALVDGALGFVVAVLTERATVDPAFRPLADRLADAGCAPLRDLLATAAEAGVLPVDLDRPAAAAALEGPLFYDVLVRRHAPAATDVPPLVNRFLAAPPRGQRG